MRGAASILGALLAGGLWLGGCASSVPAMEYYTLALPLPAAPAASQTPPEFSLLVNRFWAREPYGQSRMIYRPSIYHLAYYNYRLWASSPPEQVQEWAVRHLRAADLFSRVSTMPEAGGDLELGGVVRRFEEVDDDERDTWDAALAVDLWLVRRSDRTTLWHGSFETTQRAQKRNPESVAQAMSACLAQVLRRATDEIAQVLRRGEPVKAGPPRPSDGPAEMRHGPAEIRPVPARPPS
jgi:ABC-type uncharacterized transport system auxiliary subunit